MVKISKKWKNGILNAKRMHSILHARKNSFEETSIEKVADPIQISISPRLEKSSVLSKSTESPTEHEILIDTCIRPEELPTTCIEGRRFIDVGYFYSKLQEIASHGPMDCGLTSVKIIRERKEGLRSLFTLQCKMCTKIFYIENDAPGEVDINQCAVAGIVAIGCGHSQLQEFSAALNLPLMSARTYKKCHQRLSDHWEKVSVNSMNEAAQKERDAAIAQGRVDVNGIPIIDVIVDGCWSKRTYKKNYSALSGAAAIIGKISGEVLYLGVKNKYCSLCMQAERIKSVPKEHKCYKNYNGSSTSMESEILVEGFKNSIEMHNLIYGRMVSDGDASTYAKLMKSRPYPHITIEKIECRIHLLRNLCNKLSAMRTDTKYLLRSRKLLTPTKIMTLRKTIRNIIKAHKKSSETERQAEIELLHNDLLLAHLHTFGDHSRYKTVFCDGSSQTQTLGRDFFSSRLWARICLLMRTLASHAPSLVHDIDSNTVERYNSVVEKLVGGKRINFSKRGSYQTRYAAVVSFNTNRTISALYKSIAQHSPRGSIKKLEERRMKSKALLKKVKRKRNRKLFTKAEDKHYGENCEKPDMPTDIFEKQKTIFLRSLVKSKEEKLRIQQETVLQSACSEWLELRRRIITASNFGKIIRRRNDISCHNLVKDILYRDSIAHVRSIKHGKENELKALKQLEMQENVKIEPCGLYIDDDYSFLGATPDGLVGDDIIVEMKCPYSTYRKNIFDVVHNKKLPFYKINSEKQLTINKKHIWYYQVQGQLHVTKKKKCLFAIWSGEDIMIKIETITRDDSIWEKVMLPKLILFYNECLLPELIDPRFPRNMKIRDPEYIQKAIRENEEKRKSRKRKNNNIETDEIPTENILKEHVTEEQHKIICNSEFSPIRILTERHSNIDCIKVLKFCDF